MRRLVLVLCLVFASKAYAADEDNAPPDTAFDPTVDECAAPDAGCVPEVDVDDATLAQQEVAAPTMIDPIVWEGSGAMLCPDGATVQDGACVAGGTVAAQPAGCNASGAGLVVIVAVAGLFVIARRRRLLLALAIAACAQDASYDWDSVVDDGALSGDYVDVFSADLPSGAQFLLAHQPLATNAAQPVAAFALAMAPDAIAISKTTGACGDDLVTTAGDALLGYAHAAAGDGTAELVELTSADGCHAYETEGDAITSLVADGYTITKSLGYVWPPGMTDPVAPDTEIVAATCNADKHSPVELLYASPGATETLRFLIGCPGEVVVGEKRESGPVGAMKSATAHARGGRSGFVLDRNGDKLRDLLNRSNGVERTAAYLRHKLAIGYDYIVIDEITSAHDFADGQALNHKIRALLLRMPVRTVIPYISIDLTQEAIGAVAMKNRRYLLRAFRNRARVLALEVYQHTASVIGGHAPSILRLASDRLALAVGGLAPGINQRAITTLGTSMHSTFAQYRYLDQPSHDLDAITRQVNAIRHGSKRLRQQRGIGWYFVDKSDMAPPSAYSYDALIKRMRIQALRFH